MRILFDGTVGQLMEKDVENLIDGPVDTETNLRALIHVVPHDVPEPPMRHDGNLVMNLREKSRGFQVVPELPVPFADLRQSLILDRQEKHQQVQDHEEDQGYHFYIQT